MKAIILAAGLVFSCSSFAQQPYAIIRPAHVDYRLILLTPNVYLEKKVVMKGTFRGRDDEQELFKIRQGDDFVDVFYRDLPKETKAEILTAETDGDLQVMAGGKLLRYSNRRNTYYVLAEFVRFGSAPIGTLLLQQIELDVPTYAGKLVQLKGTMGSKNAARKSFILIQEGRTVEVSYAKMAATQQASLVKIAENALVLVRGTLQAISESSAFVAPAPYRGKRFAIIASDVNVQ